MTAVPWAQNSSPAQAPEVCLGQGGFPFHIFEVCTGAQLIFWLVVANVALAFQESCLKMILDV